MCNATRDIMDGMFEAYLEATAEPDDIPVGTAGPVWILGRKYNPKTDMEQIRRDIQSRLWFTYRRGFEAIGGDQGPITDRGWGCMLRCGQMVLAQAMLRATLGRDWQWAPESRDPTYLRVLTRFEDRRQAPFSVHQIALMGESEGKAVGQWFSPNLVAQVLKKLLKYDESCPVAIHVALHNTLVINEVLELCRTPEQTGSWKPLLLVVPLRLGLTDLNPLYVGGIKRCLELHQSLGVVGGKPGLALYFIGLVGEEALYLDPHSTQRAGPPVAGKDTPEQILADRTFHRATAARMPLASMDPSLALCFYCGSEAEFLELCQAVRDKVRTSEGQPLFEVCLERPPHWTPDQAPLQACASALPDLLDYDREFDSDEFEII